MAEGTVVAEPLTIVWPEGLTSPLRKILGLMCFQCGPIAHAYKRLGEFVAADGSPLESRAEDEQAFVLHRFVGLAFRDPDDWEGAIQREVERLSAAARDLREQQEVAHG